MQKFFVLVVLLGILALPMMAQDTPKVQIFGGYQYMYIGSNSSTGVSSVNANGWDGSVTFNVNKHFGFTGDFSGAYKGSIPVSEDGEEVGTFTEHTLTYTFGPVISMDAGGKFNPFVHFLVGGLHQSYSSCAASGDGDAIGIRPADASCDAVGFKSQNGMAMAVGGGVDLKAGKHLALRLGQFDWLYAHINGTGYSKNVRLSTGVVFNF